MAFRDERKQQTRQALLDAALSLTSGGRSFSSVSLREITREAGVVPTAFYRHFRDVEELGLAVVDESCLQLRRLMREARLTGRKGDIAIQASVRMFVTYVGANHDAFEFLVRERLAGPATVREAIARELRYFIGELANDLRIFAPFEFMPTEDLNMVADLVIRTVFDLTAEVLELPADQPRQQDELTIRAIKQLRLIFLGTVHWQSERGAVTPR